MQATEADEADDVRRFVVRVELARHDASTLLQLVSALHRRQVAIVDAAFGAQGPVTRFVATVELSARRARTLTHTLRAVIGVTDSRVDVAPAAVVAA